MAWNLRSLQKLQRDTGFNPDFLEKTHHMTRILSGIFRSSRAGEDLTLKGGTALNFVYLDVPRLSVDLDFNFTGALEKQEMLRKRKVILTEISRLAGSLGYVMSKRPGSYIMERLLLKYRRLNGLADSVRLEMNYLERIPFTGRVEKKFGHPFELGEFAVKTYALEELAAMKIKALAERLYARDVFDVSRISRLKMNRALARKLTILYLLMARKSPDAGGLIRKIERYDDKELAMAMKPFLRSGDPGASLDAGRIRKAAAGFIENLLVLDDSDREFVDSFYAGELDLKKLFGKMAFDPLADRHPGLLRAMDTG